MAQVKSVINAYVSNAQTLIDLVEAGKTSKEIDAALSIDDAPAIEGLEILFAQLRNQNPGSPLSKNYYLGQLRRALGFNGKIHQFKNYIIRHDTPRVMKATKAMEAAKSAFSSYEDLGTTATEQAVIVNVSESASRITNDTSQISQASQQLANRTETQAQTLGQTSAALNQLTISVNSVAVGAQDANTVVLDAKNYAEESAQVVIEAINAMGAIKESSSKISNIINVIDDIAFQTNLLALNAGVEAARAGEAGRGFAVVASEVRGLAQRSSDAAREIGVLINKSGEEVSRGVGLVDRAGDSLKKISTSVASIFSHVETVATSASEQATGLTKLNNAMSQLDEVTQKNVAMFEETTATTLRLSQEASVLFNTVSKFKTDYETNNIIDPQKLSEVPPEISLAS